MDRRQFLVSSAACVTGAAFGLQCDLAFAAKPDQLDAQVVRVAADRIRIEWNDKAPVSIHMANDPSAELAKMRLLAKAAKGGQAEFDLAALPRPYFLITTADGRTVKVGERVLPLVGGRNFRDMGGYRTNDRQTIRWGSLYRSGVTSDLTDADMQYLATLGLRVVCDLRSETERTKAPARFVNSDSMKVDSFNYEMGGMMRTLFAAKTREQAVASFSDAYIDMTDFLAPNYRDMFANLVAGNKPLAVNCTAGKDRTGVATALILSALGVPRHTIIADYALSDKYVPASFYLKQMRSAQPSSDGSMSENERKFMSQLPEEVLLVIMGSDPDVMRRTLALIDVTYGSPINMIKSKYGVTDTDLAKLRQIYLA
jgi:protein-tyrosine phosphatase